MEITTESPLLPWLVRQCDEPGGLLELSQEEQRNERCSWSKSCGEGHARAYAHEFPKLVRLLRARAEHKEP